MGYGQLHKFFRYNEFLNRIVPVIRPLKTIYSTIQRGKTRYEEYHKPQHPTQIQDAFAILKKVSRIVDPLDAYPGDRDNIGSYITLKTLPSITNVCIKKNVQYRAIVILCERIKDEASRFGSMVQIKRYRKGKKGFELLWTTKQIQASSVEYLSSILSTRLGSKKYIHLKIKAKY